MNKALVLIVYRFFTAPRLQKAIVPLDVEVDGGKNWLEAH